MTSSQSQMKKVPLLDLQAQYGTICEEIRGAVDRVFDSQQFVASIIFHEPRAPAIWWTPNYKQVTIDAETVDLEKLRAGIQDMLRDSWELFFTLTDGKKFTNKLPNNLKING